MATLISAALGMASGLSGAAARALAQTRATVTEAPEAPASESIAGEGPEWEIPSSATPISETPEAAAAPAEASPSSTEANPGSPATSPIAPADSPRNTVVPEWISRSCQDSGMHPDADNGAQIDTAVECLINRLRYHQHVPLLHVNVYLHSVAATQVSAMLASNHFADDPAGRTPLAMISSTRYAPRNVRISSGQNSAWGTGSDATPTGIVTAWMESPPHREILLSGLYTDLGVAAGPALPANLRHGRAGAIYVAEFAARLTRVGRLGAARSARYPPSLRARLRGGSVG